MPPDANVILQIGGNWAREQFFISFGFVNKIRVYMLSRLYEMCAHVYSIPIIYLLREWENLLN